MSIDIIKEIVDKEMFESITYSMQYEYLFKLQVNIQSPVPSPETPEFSNRRFYSPTPCQYAVMLNKSNFLELLINYMCNQKEDYERGLKLSISSVFCPNCSNVPWPLLQLSIAYSSLNSLVILIKFLKEQNCLEDYINFSDNDGRTPLSVAFATGNEEIINILLENGADPFFGVDDHNSIIPIINTIIHYKNRVPQAIDCIRKFKGDDFNPFLPISHYYFDTNGYAYSTQDNHSVSLEEFLRGYPEIHTLYESLN